MLLFYLAMKIKTAAVQSSGECDFGMKNGLQSIFKQIVLLKLQN